MLALESQYRNWNRTAPSDGLEFEQEFERIYRNLETLKTALNQTVLPGYVLGRVNTDASNNSVIIPKLNVYDVGGKLVPAGTDKSLNLSALTNIYRNDGTTLIVSSAEIQNKHLYIMLDDLGVLSAMIIPDAELDSGTHTYASNPDLVKDSFKASPGIFSSAKNGYYKGTKRIIATLRLNSSNQIQFLYELGFGRKYMDLQNVKVGQIFTEDRWKREHPGCFLAEGDTISAMNTDFPELYKFLNNSNILPDYRGRVPRSISMADLRSIRDTQEDAFQGFKTQLDANVLESGMGGSGGGIGSSGSSQTTGSVISDGVNGTPRISDETRMKNFAVMIQIVKG